MRGYLGSLVCFRSYSGYQVLKERGFIFDETPNFKEILQKPTHIYAGYDPTADGLHLGSLVSLLALCHLHKVGHTPVIVLGGCTGLIGDPSGRETERSLLDEEVGS